MCGIIGAFWPEPPPDHDRRIQQGLARLAHRGPDDQGVVELKCFRGHLVLGHTRLSIIDLSPGGHQPMQSADGRFTIAYNGEIYNYRELRSELCGLGHVFHTESDTEVLLAAWSQWNTKCLRRLTGMFAFAVFDRQTSTLSLVRDAFGIKPLFFADHVKGFYFASEIPALLALLPGKTAMNLQRAYDYLVNAQYDDQAESFFAGIRHLQPGHLLTVGLNARGLRRVIQWWRPKITERTDLSLDQATQRLRDMFMDNVRLHLRSDVSLGAALSGGIDSSAVVCAMRKIEPDMPIHTFSFLAQGSELNEAPWAELVATHVRAKAHQVIVGPKELAADLDDMIQTQGEPFGSTSIYAQYRVFKLAREHGMTVVLDGQGADELLAGYAGYPGARMRSLLEQGRIGELVRFALAWRRWPGRSLGRAAALLAETYTPQRLRRTALNLIGMEQEPKWLNLDVLREAGVRLCRRERPEHPEDAGRRLAAALREASSRDGLPALLRHADRNAMRWSVESRVPFLTTELAEFTLSLPESYLVSPTGETKHVFRLAMRGIVPDRILNRRDKIGFATPEREWLRAMKPRIEPWLEDVENLPFVRATALRKAVATGLEKTRGSTFQAWRLINFCRWAQLMSEHLNAGAIFKS